MTLAADYFHEIKNYLDFTYSDQDMDDKLIGVCKRAESYLSKVAGSTIEFSKNMKDQSVLQLLFDCIRYIWCGSFDDFPKNYEEELFMLRANVHAISSEEKT